MILLFFFNDTATTEIYTLSLHDALPISQLVSCEARSLADRGNMSPQANSNRLDGRIGRSREVVRRREEADRKSTRLNSSHGYISYAVFCLKKKKILL